MKYFRNANIILGGVLIVAIFTVQYILPIQIAKAASDPIKECGVGAVSDIAASAVGYGVGYLISLLGGPTPVFDATAIAKLTATDINNCIRSLEDMLFKVALAKLKKRLLDRITDDTIEWINNGAKGRPRFVENFGDTLRESANEAVGDTAREIGLGKLCDEKLSLKLQLNLKKPATKQFRQDASCTLDKIVGNIDNFGKDFRNGGWVGYTEALSPNNNRFGLEILALDQTYQTQTQKDQEVQMAAASGGGFKGVEACAYWEVIFEKGADTFSKIKSVYDFNGSDFDLARDPNASFNEIQLKTLFGALSPDATPVTANCDRKEITMPAQVVKGQTDQALQGDKDIIANADDLSLYISAIFDAAINRIAKNALEGIGIKQGGSGGSSILTNSGTGRQSETYGTSTRDLKYKGYGQEYATSTDTKASLRDSITKNTAEIKTQISELDLTLPGYIESIREVQERIKYLTQCEIQKSDNIITLPITNVIVHQTCESTNSTLTTINEIFDSAIEFQSFIAKVKGELNKNQDLSNSGQMELTSILSTTNTNLSSIKNLRSGLQQNIDKLEEIDRKVDTHKKQCLASTSTYNCPAAF